VFVLQESSRRCWTVRILQGEFEKSREPSDLVEEKESYGGFSSTCKLRRKLDRRIESTGFIGSLTKSHFRVSRVGRL
jgi:hypothetical protein